MRILIYGLLLLGLCSGCSMVQEDTETALMETKRSLKVKPGDYGDGTEDLDEDWSFVGKEGRAGMPVERDNDRFLRKWTMSEKARDIEANLGIE
ncbi:MAG: hypothetical protein R3C11_15865 [Planctomycetaceae bacterium]